MPAQRFDLVTTRWYGWARSLVAAIVFALLLAATGCSRSHYYCQADKDASKLVAEKACDPRWALPPGFTVDKDPRSRYYDPCDQIFPPMPPDDPASDRLMVCLDGMKGFRHWHDHGDRQQLDNPEWRARLPQCAEMTDEGRVKLSLPAAVRLAYLNSPDYQTQLETLYLSAIDVSTERFRFETQFFGTNNTTLTRQGPLNPNGEATTLETDTNFQLERAFAAGGELVVGLANSIVWQFAGPATFSNISILNFNLMQPLLRGAGRAVALEQLTIVERALLANLRTLQLYREGLYMQLAIGDANSAYLQRRGGFFGGTGMTGFTGTGIGGFGNVGGYYFTGGSGNFFGGGGAAGGGGYVGGGAAAVGGFIGLLQSLQQIRNLDVNLDLKLQALGLLEAHRQAGTISLTQVDEFRQSIETQRAGLLQSHNGMETSLELFKIGNLGLPPDVPVEVDDGFIRPFQFITPAISNLQKEFADLLRDFGQQPKEPTIEVLQQFFQRLADLWGQLERQLVAVNDDMRNLEAHCGARRATMTPGEEQTFVAEIASLQNSLRQLQQRVQQADAKIAQLRGQLAQTSRRQAADQLVQLVTEVARMADEISLIQARSRVEAITVQSETLDPDTALNIARANRLDWMNNRAALVDTWRLIEYNANALQAGMNVVFSGQMGTVGNNPVQFRAPTGSLQVGLQFDAPFTRLLERNNYRQAIIDYQQQRRQLIQWEDYVQETLRALLRNLELDKVNLEIQRRAVVIAIRRVDETREVLNQPPPEPPPGQTAGQLGPTVAQDLSTALNDLSGSQYTLTSVWLDYYATRMRLAHAMGVMQLNDCGLWIDQPLSGAAQLKREEVPLPPPLPANFADQLRYPPSPPGDQAGPPAPAQPVETNVMPIPVPPAEPSPGQRAP